MEAKKIINLIRTQLSNLLEQKIENVSVKGLDSYLERLEGEVDQSNSLRQIDHQRNLAYYDAKVKFNVEMFKSVIEAGKEALNSVVIINGGAVIALLGFLSSLVSKGDPGQIGRLLAMALAVFGSGVLFGALGFGGRYVAQYFYSVDKNMAGGCFNLISVAFAIFAYIFFGLGVFKTYDAFQIHFVG